jgi:hypothetical protein
MVADDVDYLAREITTRYLASPLAGRWLKANGLGSGARVEELLPDLPVLKVDGRLHIEIRRIVTAMHAYVTWTGEAMNRIDSVFSATEAGPPVDDLLSFARIEDERCRAGAGSTDFRARVRSRYPRPIALRRLQMPMIADRDTRVTAIVQCAEYLLDLLAIMSLIQLAPDHDIGTAAGSQMLKAAVSRSPNNGLTWGAARNIVLAGATKTARIVGVEERLSYPFPELGRLKPTLESERWTNAQEALFGLEEGAETILRNVRNRQAHKGGGSSEPEVLLEALDVFLEDCEFLTGTPLLYVTDYDNERTRKITADLLVGTDRIPVREEFTVDSEVKKHSLAFLDANGVLRPTEPFLYGKRTDPLCPPQIFLFDRLDPKGAVFLGMEDSEVHVDAKRGIQIRELFETVP